MCNKNCQGYTEMTMDVNGGAEVMIHICVTCGTVSDLYTYEKDARYIEYYNEKKDDYVPLAENWKSEFNKLFVKCPPAKRIWTLKKIFNSDYSDATFCINRETEEEEAEEKAIVHRMLNRYGLDSMEVF